MIKREGADNLHLKLKDILYEKVLHYAISDLAAFGSV